MKQTIQHFCEEHKHGLFLLDMPTGFGKTHHVLEFIAEKFDDPKYKDRKFIFITPLKNNLPIEKLRGMFEDKGKGEEFDDAFIFLNSKVDSIKENLIDKVDKKTKIGKYEIKPLLEYGKEKGIDIEKNFDNLANTCKRLADKNHDMEYQKMLEDKVKETEAIFRKHLCSFLKDKAKEENRQKPEEFYQMIKQKYAWVIKMYPAVETLHKRIIFMSVHKFYYGNTTLIEPYYRFVDNNIIDDSIIFIDEFDATHESLLEAMIDDNTNKKIDIISFFRALYFAFCNRSNSLASFAKDSVNFKDKRKTWTCEQLVSEVKESIQAVYDRYNMQNIFKYENTENKRNFLFNYCTKVEVIGDDNLYIDPDENEGKNYLSNVKSELELKAMIKDISGCINYISWRLEKLAENYKFLQNEKSSLTELFTPEDARDSLIDIVFSKENSGDFYEYMKNCMLQSKIGKGKKSKKSGENDVSNDSNDSFYDTGFRYYEVRNDTSHNESTEIAMYELLDSPEKMIAKVAQKACVVGISATATMDSVISNYSSEYFTEVLDSDDYQSKIRREDLGRLQTEYQNKTKNYKEIEIHAEPVSANIKESNKDIDTNAELKTIFEKNKNIEIFTRRITAYFNTIATKKKDNKGKTDFLIKRFLQKAKVLKKFLLDENMHVFLYMGNNKPKDDTGKEHSESEILKDMAEEIIKENKLNLDTDIIFEINGKSNEYENKKEALIKRLETGKKTFIIAAYNTIGTGQNLQYKIPKNLQKSGDIVEIFKYDSSDEKEKEMDIDAIYLEQPTNIIQQINCESTDEEIMYVMFQNVALTENQEITEEQFAKRIKTIFNATNSYKTKQKKPETLSTQNAYMAKLIQALGRICRTNYKNKHINIFLDEQICSSLKDYDFDTITNGKLVSPELHAMIDCIRNYDLEEVQNSEAEERYERINRSGYFTIKEYFKNGGLYEGDAKKIREWEGLREFVLRHPILRKNPECFLEEKTLWGKIIGPDLKDFEKIVMQQVYISTKGKMHDSYYYRQKNDFEKCKISFAPQTQSEFKNTVSFEDMKRVLDAIPGLKEYFKNNGYDTEFKTGRYILSPIMFNNIYKGAFGEAVLSYIFKGHLKNMEAQNYEKFDFMVKEGVYVDAKFWSPTFKDARAEIEKIRGKLEECGGGKVAIINTKLNENVEGYQPTESSDILEIPNIYKISEGKYILDQAVINRIEDFLQM